MTDTEKAREQAEKQFAALQKQSSLPLTDAEQKAKTVRDNTARLKAMRLAKEAQKSPK